ncbi:MAG: hypothetical protein KA149_00310 [Chitinophagales bacterium]|nr:hypothetical protein [Chitinophagales bacterium]
MKSLLPVLFALCLLSYSGCKDIDSDDFKDLSFVTHIDAGMKHTLFVKSNNTLWVTGSNTEGQLAIPTVTEMRGAVKAMDNVLIAAAGYSHSLIIKTDHTLWACGLNHKGQLGNGTLTDQRQAVKILDSVLLAAGGLDFSLIIKQDNTLWGVGNNEYGQLGVTSTLQTNFPVKIMDNVKAVSCGQHHSVILRTDNTVWVTGQNFSGQLGIGSYSNISTPVQIMESVESISAGTEFTLLVKLDHTLWATGSNTFGQLGLVTGAAKINVPEQITAYAAMAKACFTHTLVFRNDTAVLQATGNNSYGQFGNPTLPTSSYTLIDIGGGTDVLQLSGGQGYSVVLDADHIPHSAGQNDRGQLGLNTNTATQNTLKEIKVY